MAPCLESRYCTLIVSFLGIILTLADPTTDILALVEFYREDHKAWFAVGLTFVILPCVAYSVIYWWCYPVEQDNKVKCAKFFFYGVNPLSPTLVRIQVLWKDIKRCWRADKGMDTDQLRLHNEWVRFGEAVFEAAPQFILQLYAMIVQQKQVQIIQIVSLPLSFLSLVWASTSADDPRHFEETSSHINVLTAKHKVFLFATQLLLLSSRLFAIALFIVSFQWWIISVLITHSMTMLIVDVYWLYRRDRHAIMLQEIAAIFWLYWLRDDSSLTLELPAFDTRTQLRKILLFSNVLFIIENCAMIISFYFSPFSNTWYSLPVTVCVCSFSVIGAAARVAIFRSLTKPIVSAEGPTQSSNNQRYLY